MLRFLIMAIIFMTTATTAQASSGDDISIITNEVRRPFCSSSSSSSSSWSSQEEHRCGPRGPEGPEGPRGPRGHCGPQGRDGEDGLKGSRGPRGHRGPQGRNGENGLNGAPGPAGAAGATGAGATGATGSTGATGPTGSCECDSRCLVGMITAFFDTDFPANQPVLPPGTTETFGSVVASAWSRTVPGMPLTLYNKDLGAGSGEQGLGISGAPDNEINNTNFIQLDIQALLSMSTIPSNIGLTIQSVQTGEDFEIYQSSVAGVLGTLIASGNNPGTGGVIQVIQIPLSALSPRFLNITTSTGDVLLSALTIPQCESISAPLLLVIDSSITTPDSITGSFIGQLGFFEATSLAPNQLRAWNGTAWVP